MTTTAPTSKFWRETAACRTADAALFDYDHDNGRNDREPEPVRQNRYALAREICAHCPVAEACLNEALTDEHTEGVRAGYLFWGGRPVPDTYHPNQPLHGHTRRPCGTAAAKRHHKNGEPLDDDCRQALNAWERNRRQARGHTGTAA
jgi:hypothetical protein